MKNLLIGVTASVAAKLTPKLIKKLSNYNLKIIVTEKSLYFIPEDFTAKLLNHEVIEICMDGDDWLGGRYTKDQYVMHVELAKWADLFLICPLTANTLSKMATGLCDNLLTTTVRAWDASKPMVIAPAMNTQMWNNMQTAEDIEKVKHKYNAEVVYPVSKKLACGDEGMGALADLDDIVNAVNACFEGEDE